VVEAGKSNKFFMGKKPTAMTFILLSLKQRVFIDMLVTKGTRKTFTRRAVFLR
jgi:hypothetical protein